MRVPHSDDYLMISNPAVWPEGQISSIEEPMILGTVVVPKDYMGAIIKLCQVSPYLSPSFSYQVDGV